MTKQITDTIATGAAGIVTIQLTNVIPLEAVYSLVIQGIVAVATLLKLYKDSKRTDD